MFISAQILWGIIGGMSLVLIALITYLHKDMTQKLDKLSDMFTAFMRLVDKHELQLVEHDRKHSAHDRKHEELTKEIDGLKKNIQSQDIRITKIEDKI
jgi:hypothetical protein